MKPAVTIWYRQHEDLLDTTGGDRGIDLAGLAATCLPLLPGTAPSWSNHIFSAMTGFVIELPACPFDSGALRRHLRASRGVETGERAGSRTRCDP
jgi:hypothetical protein